MDILIWVPELILIYYRWDEIYSQLLPPNVLTRTDLFPIQLLSKFRFEYIIILGLIWYEIHYFNEKLSIRFDQKLFFVLFSFPYLFNSEKCGKSEHFPNWVLT